MNQYHKIQTVFKRDPDNNYKTLLINNYSLPAFEYLKDNEWTFTEKVDGTNIRVMWDQEELTFGGKTDRAQTPKFLTDALDWMFSAALMADVFSSEPVCLYGEGYGPKIQKGGKYLDAPSFVLFDVRVGDWWLERSSVIGIGESLGVKVVPIIGHGNIADMVKMTRQGFSSQWGDFIAEGIVARPSTELKSRNGDRIITKIKHKDFN